LKNKVFIYGLGSIGQRYARLLRSTYGDDIDIFTRRRRNRKELIDPTLQSSRTLDPSGFYKIQEVNELNDLPAAIDLSIIASPIHLHFNDLMEVNNFTNSKRILVEKPLSGMNSKTLTPDEKRALNTLMENEIFIAFQSRYSKLYEHLSLEISKFDRNSIYGYQSWFSENLESMHPYEDYKASHMGNKLQQGDPMSCFSHDIDVLISLMGEAKVVDYFESKKSYLEITTPDIQRITLTIDKYPKIHSQIYFDFIGWPPRRGGEIMLRDGRIVWNWLTQEITTQHKSRGIETYSFASVSRDEMFIEMLTQLLEAEKKSEIKAATLKDALKVNDIIVQSSRLINHEN